MDSHFSPEVQKFIDQSLDDPAILKWLAKFDQEGIPDFLASYHRQRQQWLHVGAHERKKKHEWLTIDMERAEKVLFFIQQKKLFDLQCLWRAEQEQVPGIRHAADFLDLEENIRAIDMLSPITAEELQILKGWLTDYHLSQRLYPYDGWQYYNRYIRQNQERGHDAVPSLYKYMDLHTKTISLWKILPDIRGQKEEKYMRAAVQERIRNSKSQSLLKPVEHRPMLYGSEEYYGEFAKAFEDHNLNECREAYDQTSFHHEDHALTAAIETLENALEPVAMEPHADWRAAIKYTAWKYERKRLLPSLDVAFENYCFRLQMGIGLAPMELHRGPHHFASDQEVWAQEILDGRKALGEPLDFDF